MSIILIFGLMGNYTLSFQYLNTSIASLVAVLRFVTVHVFVGQFGHDSRWYIVYLSPISHLVSSCRSYILRLLFDLPIPTLSMLSVLHVGHSRSCSAGKYFAS